MMPLLDENAVREIARELERNGSRTVVTNDPEGVKNLLLTVTKLKAFYEQEAEVSGDSKEIPVANTYNFYLETDLWGKK
jgi:hypothetical protein